MMKNYEEPHAKPTILVLTEFNKSAKIAAEYALALAQELHANMMLFNSFIVPTTPHELMSSHVYINLKKNSCEHLKQEVKRLEEIIKGNKHAFIPEINSLCEEGALIDNVDDIVKLGTVMMIVIGGKYNDDEDLLSEEMHAILKEARLPILIVPEY